MIRISELSVGRRTGQLVTGESRPALSWQFESDSPSALQESYELEVASDAQFSANKISSGEINNASQIQQPWIGLSLRSREVRFVRVRIKVAGAWSPWSEAVRVEAGLLNNLEWSAVPVTDPLDLGDKKLPAPLLFRKEFEVASDVSLARLYATGFGIFEISINGKKVSDDLFAPGWTSYSNRLQSVTYDVKNLLKPGKNVITAELADGWYRGQFTWWLWRNIFGTRLGLMAQLEISDKAGVRNTIATDSTWRVSTGEIISADFYEGCSVDLRKAHAGWEGVGFADSTWREVEVLRIPKAQIIPFAAPSVRVVQKVKPVSQAPNKANSTIYDFGQNLTGVVRVKVQGKAGDKVTITQAEVLKNGQLHRHILRFAKAIDEFILADDNAVELTPRFTFHGYRFAEIESNAKILEVETLVIHTDLVKTSHFECSNLKVNQLHENITWSQRANFISVPTDCPQRDERLGWTGDIQAFGPTANTLYDSESFLANWLVDLAHDQYEDGAIPHVIPDILTQGEPTSNHGALMHGAGKTMDGAAGRAGWADAATIVPLALLEAYGDLETIRTQYPSMQAWVNHLESRLTTENLLKDGEFQFGDWLDPDAPASNPAAAKCDKDLVANSFAAYSALLLSQFATLLGRKDEQLRYFDLYQVIRTATWKKWQSDFTKTYTGCAIAIKLEIAPSEKIAEIGAALAGLIKEYKGKISSGFLGTAIIMPALSMVGQNEAAYDLLLNEEIPGWLYQINQGATSMWERWDGIRPDGSMPDGNLDDAATSMLSFNHYAYGAVAAWLYRDVAGIAPDVREPGYAKIIFQPRPDSRISWAKADVDTRYGKAGISWREVGDKHLAEIEIPAGARATFIFRDGKSKEFGSGKYEVNF